MSKIFITAPLVLLLLLQPINALLDKFIWSDCGSRQVSFSEVRISPAPIVNPGQVSITLRAKLARSINGSLNTDLNIERTTISGVTIPIKCFKVIRIIIIDS